MLEWKVVRGCFCATALVAAAFCGATSGAQEKPRTGAVVVPVYAAQLSAAGEDHRIGAGDVVKIDVWMCPDISRTIPVRGDGDITLPLTGVLKVSGLSAMELAGLIRRKLEDKINNPQVTVTVVGIRGVNSMPSFPLVPPAVIPPTRQFQDTPSPVPHLDCCSSPQGVRPA
jgi:hypothetical protein